MKFDKIAEKEGIRPAAGHQGADGGYVLFADFLPAETPAAVAASDLILAAQARAPATSATFAPESFARVALSCRTPMHFRRAQQRVADMDLASAAHVIVVLDSFRRAELQSLTWVRRLKERWRILSLLTDVLARRARTRLIAGGLADRCYGAAARALCLLTRGRLPDVAVHLASDLLSGRLPRQVGLSAPDPSAAARWRAMEGHGGSARRLTAQRLAALAHRTAHGDDLRFLAEVASAPDLKAHPTVRWLRMAAAGADALHPCPAPHPQMDMAQAPAAEAARFGVPITRYMMHLHTVLNLQRELPLTNRRQALAFADWYQKRGSDRVPAKWVPTAPDDAAQPPDGSEATTRVQRARRILRAVLDSAEPQGPPDAEMHGYLAGIPHGSGPSRFAVLLATLCQIPVRSHPDRTVWTAEDISRWFDTTACGHLPACRAFSATVGPPAKPVSRIEFYGMTTSKTGLGTNTQMILRMLKQLRVPHVLIDTDQCGQVAGPQRPPTGLRPLARQVVLHQVNADRIPLHMMSPRLARRNAPYHIGFLLWELDRIPECHRLGTEMLDEIWAPSCFVRDLYARETATPVHLVKKGLMHLDYLRHFAAGARGDPDRFTALVCFDFHSGVERKNPLAAVRAFQIAFPARQHRHCRLIVKTTPTTAHHWGDPHDQMGQIRKLAARDPRIAIVEAFVPQARLWRMMQSADCIISPHRAEGFGYIPAYALAMAKPLVTTDYGGPRDFCDAQTSFPVAPTLTGVPTGHPLYFPAGARWADVSPETLAEALRQVHDDPGMAATRGRNGQRRIARDYSMPAFAARCQHRLQQIGAL